ncbi:6-bladed beta-propeller [Desulfosporosinus fructosivorans]|uniref:6-bladed beta-propeller n=1 Tax=Desulfosporosinus fructosivorans TaxID=2018669 RepID=A0A4Z0R6V5_9FIRM|nr:cell wall-binding repeat-containing protein [Desulfosporosinus fructosivorans]TGE37386.1 6-bladed beta-propeller [Desulfosporosinus fructosivorans]
MNQGTRNRILRLILALMLVVSFIGGTQAFAATSSSTLVPERQSFFSNPRGIAVDSTGNIYVADTSNNRIQKFNSTGTLLATWGTAGSGHGQFSNPSGIVVDNSTSNVYVVDTSNNRIQVFSSTGTYLTQWGEYGSGNGQFSAPSGVAVDSERNVYVADTSNNRIQKFRYTGDYLTQWGTTGSGDGQFSAPSGVAVDSTGYVYVTDSSYRRVQKFSSTGTYVTQWGTAGNGNGQFINPSGIAVDSTGNVYVADAFSNNRIQKFSSTGTYLTKWGTTGSGDGQFDTPVSITVDSAGNVYVADCGNNRIQKFNSTGAFLASWQTTGSGDGQFNSPNGVAVDNGGNIYVADTNNNRIQKFDSTGTFVTKWGSIGSGDGQFSAPFGVAVDSGGNIYVSDAYNHRIQKFNSAGAFVTKWGTAGSGTGQFNTPTGIAVDSGGNIYVADTYNSRIQKFSPAGGFVASWGVGGSGDGQFNMPYGVAVDSMGNIYVADTYNNRIQKLDSTGAFVTKWGSGGSGDGQFDIPAGIAVDSGGIIYVADSYNHRVQKFDSAGTFIAKWGSNGNGDGQFNGPCGMTADSVGNIYVADTDNHRIQVTNSDAGLTSVSAKTINAGPEAGTDTAPKTASVNVANITATVASGDIAGHGAGATVTFYGTDTSFTTPETGSVSLTAGGATTVYIKVTAQDMITVRYYAVTINREAAPGAPSITTHPSDQTVTAGQTATFTVAASGTAPLSYQWKNDGVDIIGAASSTLTITNVQASDAGSYTCYVSNGAGNITSNAATLTVNPAPVAPAITIATQPAALTNVTESSISGSLTVAAAVHPSGTPAYEWFSCDDTSHTNPVTTGVTANTFTIPTTLTAGSYYYYCEVRAAGATPVNSNVATVVVNSAPSGTAPAVISINPISLDLGGTNTATIQVKLGQSGGNPNVLAGKATVTTTGGAISVTPATPADLTADGSITVTGISTGAATVSIGFSGGDVAFGDTKYDRIITVNVTDSSISPPSDAKDVTGVATPGGASISGAAITATVANGVTSQAIALSVSANASWKLYSDAACLNEIIDKTMVLSVGPNAAYVQVTAENGTTKVYTLTITRQEAVPAGNYTISISPLAGGTITASPTSATSGSAINLTISPNPGMRLQAGSLKYNDGTTDHPISGTSFTMPAANVTISAVFEAVPNSNGGSGGGSSGGGSAASGGTTVTGSVINGATGANVSNITATVTTDSSGNKTVSMPAAQLAIFKQPDGSTSQFSDITKLTITTAAGSTITISSDGTIQVPNLAKGTDNVFKMTYDLGNGQTITIGTIDIKTDSSGNVSLTISLIDPYGIIIEAATGKALQEVNVTLYYANTDRNKAAGKTPDTVVALPGIDGFKPNNNKNPQVSDVSGSYGFMVFPVSDYYIVAAKEGYEQYKSPTISVEQDIVKWDFKMNQAIKGVKRLSGLTRIDTALEIAKANYSSKVANVILATADNYPDALAGSVLAYKLNAPILLVDSTNAGQEKVLDYMKSNMDSAGTVYILGGTGAVSSAVEAKVTASGFNHVTRLGGADCYETSVKIAGQLDIKTGTPIVLVSGENYPDALSISSTAAVMQSPILLVQNDGLSDAVKNEITAIKPAKVYIIGLQGVISTSVENQVAQITGLTQTNIVRIGGADRYETSLAVAKYFNLSGQNVCIATGNDFTDALAGSVYAANYNAAIILADKTLSDNETTYLKNRELPGATILGGEGAVSQNVQQQISELMKR